MSPADDGFWKRKRERDEKDDREAKDAIAPEDKKFKQRFLNPLKSQENENRPPRGL